MMSESTRTYLPAAGFDWSLPLYDPIVKLLGGDKARMVLLDHAALQPGYRVLDIGCGTGTLATLIKRVILMSRWLESTPTPRLLPAPDAKQRRRGFPSNSTRDLEMTFHTPRRASTVQDLLETEGMVCEITRVDTQASLLDLLQ
jgi:hypothetical protein